MNQTLFKININIKIRINILKLTTLMIDDTRIHLWIWLKTCNFVWETYCLRRSCFQNKPSSKFIIEKKKFLGWFPWLGYFIQFYFFFLNNFFF